MPSLTRGATSTAREREKAAARSAKLTDIFDQLAAADARVRRRGSIELEDVEDAADVASPGPSEQPRDGRRRRVRGAAQANLLNAPAPPVASTSTCTATRHQGNAVLLRSGRAVVLSAGSRRLPPPFHEQARVLSSVEATTKEVQSTLKHLHRDLAVHNRGHSSRRNYRRRSAAARWESEGAESPSNSSEDSDRGFYGSSTTTAAAQRRMMEEEARAEKMRIQRARAAAADEGAADDQSVEDYGVDCEIPPLTSESKLEDEVATIAAHLSKAKTSALAMAEVEELAPTTSAAPWWSSALRLRDMKAAAARLDYHARAAQGWSYRAREQLLLQVAHLNNVSTTIRTQLLQQQQHWQEFQSRLRDGQQAVTQAHAAIAQWQAQTQAEVTRRAKLQEETLARARATAVVDAAETNQLKAELALLLTEREWPSRALQHDAQTVLEWLRSASTPLE